MPRLTGAGLTDAAVGEAEPTQASPLKVQPALQQKPAPTPAPGQITARGVLHAQHANTGHRNGSPQHHHKNKDTHPKRAHGKSAHGKSAHTARASD